MNAVAPKAEKDWQAQSDLRTCREAMEIRADKARWAAVQKEAKAQRAALEELGEDTDSSYKAWKKKKADK